MRSSRRRRRLQRTGEIELTVRVNASAARSTFASGTACLLLTCAMNQRMKRRIPAHVQCADSFGCINFVADGGEQIDAELIRIDRDLAKRLSGVRMKDCTAGMRDSR